MSTSLSKSGRPKEGSKRLGARAPHHSATEHTLTKHGIPASIDEDPSKAGQEQQNHATGNGYNTGVSTITSAGASNASLASLTYGPYSGSMTNGESQGQRLTRGALVVQQRELSHFHTNPERVLAAREAQQERLEAAACTLGFALPASATENYAGVTPTERYKAERDDGKGPWTAGTRRR